MIYPTSKSVFIALVGAVVALLIVGFAPEYWTLGFAWAIGLSVAMVADMVLSPWPSHSYVRAELPVAMQVGRDVFLSFNVAFSDSAKHLGFRDLEAQLETSELITAERLDRDGDVLSFKLLALRRGSGELRHIWLRWAGPLGLVYKSHKEKISRPVKVASNTEGVETDAIEILIRENMTGSKVGAVAGEGSEFEALREFQAGMDNRTIDWKQSARHRKLFSREYRIEQNSSIYFAVDTSRLMSSPVLGGIARVDHAINSALMLAFVSLKLGDRVGFFAFDEKPIMKTGFVSGGNAFARLQTLSADLDYSVKEPNHTLAFTSLGDHLKQRSLVIMFTEFSDTTSAELLLASVPRLLKNHIVLFVLFEDDELQSIIGTPPETITDITRAVVADSLLAERELVIAKLRDMGADVIYAPAAKTGADWLELERLLEKATRGSATSLSAEEILALPKAYQATLSALSVARATSLDRAMIDYLESLCTRAHFFVYGERQSVSGWMGTFIWSAWPRAVKSMSREILLAVAVMMVSALVAYTLVISDQDWFYAFVPESLAAGRTPASTTESLRATIADEHDVEGLSAFATYLFTHNSRVALFAFALGFAFGVPTLFLLAYNGFVLGAFATLFVSRGLGYDFFGWLLIHGVTELLAVAIAGAAGVKIGWAIASPGDLSRLDAAKAASRQGALALIGVVAMLLVAGLLEGFGRQLITSTETRYLGIDLQLKLATVGERLGAFCFDLFLIVCAVFALAFTLGLAGFATGAGEFAAVLWFFGFFVLRYFYFSLFEMGKRAATPGKRLFGIRVVPRDGAYLSAEHVIVRNVMREVEVFLPVSLILTNQVDGVGSALVAVGFLWSALFALFPFFNRDRLRPGDILAGTWVIKAPKYQLQFDLAASGEQEMQAYHFTPVELDAYGVKELHVLEEVLRAQNPATITSVAERIRKKVGRNKLASEEDAAFLEAYYTALRKRLEELLLSGVRKADKFDAS
eukprot:s1_g1446.t1